MNIVQKGILNLAIKTGVVSGGNLNGVSEFYGMGSGYSFGGMQNDNKLINEGYASNTDVYAIVKKISETGSSIPFLLYEKTKDGEILVESGGLWDVLQQPNGKQIFKEFHEESLGYILTTGDLFYKGGKSFGFGEEFRSIYNLPSNLVDLIFDNNNQRVRGYALTLRGNREILTTDEIYHGKYFNPTTFGIDSQRGLSPLQAGYRSLIASNELITAEASVYKNKGVSGILSSGSESVTMTKNQALEVEESIRQRLGGASKSNGVSTTSANIKFTQIGMSPADMEILKSGNVKLQQLCRIYGVDSKLFGDPKASTWNNVTQVDKKLYTDAVIPNNERLVSYLNRFLVPGWSKSEKKDYVIRQDLSKIEALQVDKKTEAEKGEITSRSITGILSSPISRESKIATLTKGLGYSQDDAEELVGPVVIPLPGA